MSFSRFASAIAVFFLTLLISLLTVSTASAQFIILEPEGFESSGPGAKGGVTAGPFLPFSKKYSVFNPSATVGFVFSASENIEGMSVSPAAGFIPPFGTATVTVSVDSEADDLGAGSTANGKLTVNGVERDLKLIAQNPAELEVTGGNYTVIGPEGTGPFTPAEVTYTLKNIGEFELKVEASACRKII